MFSLQRNAHFPSSANHCVLKVLHPSPRLHRTFSSALHQNHQSIRLMSEVQEPSSNGTPDKRLLHTDKMAYTNCKTQIIDLSPLNLPDDPKTPDSSLRQIYRDYINTHRSHDPNTVDARDKDQIRQAEDLAAAILSLKTGIAPPVAFPTETVYGLGADATNAASIAGIFAAKGRPSDNPLIVHVSSTEHLERCLGGTETRSAIPEIYKNLVAEFWPGPLTILIPVPEEGKGVKFAPNVHPGQKTIGFRVPSSLHARFLMAVTDRPIAAPSANSSGKPSPTTAQHVKDDLDGKINFILDGGSCDVGVESTVVDGLGDAPLILRPGGVSKSALRSWGKRMGNVWQHVENGYEAKKHKNGIKRKRSEMQQINGASDPKVQRLIKEGNAETNGHMNPPLYESRGTSVEVEDDEDDEDDSESTAAPRAPGMKYKHYAPKGRMVLFESSSQTESTTGLEPVQESLRGLLASREIEIKASDEHRQSSSSSRPLTIGILPSTSWPDRHKIQRYLQPNNSNPAAEPKMTFEIIELGTTSATISRNLFAALRKCDDLGCDYIFAEAPSRAVALKQDSNSDRVVDSTNGGIDEVLEEDFETVLERMRKAASEVVQV